MADRYFVLRCTEDGDHYIGEFTKEQVLKNIQPYSEDEPPEWDDVADAIPRSLNSFVGQIIIKGEIVVPTPKTVVKEYDLP